MRILPRIDLSGYGYSLPGSRLPSSLFNGSLYLINTVRRVMGEKSFWSLFWRRWLSLYLSISDDLVSIYLYTSRDANPAGAVDSCSGSHRPMAVSLSMICRALSFAYLKTYLE